MLFEEKYNVLKNPTSLRFFKKLPLSFRKEAETLSFFFSLSFFKSVKKHPCISWLCHFFLMSRKIFSFYRKMAIEKAISCQRSYLMFLSRKSLRLDLQPSRHLFHPELQPFVFHRCFILAAKFQITELQLETFHLQIKEKMRNKCAPRFSPRFTQNQVETSKCKTVNIF